jgi:hypothetical protein
VKSRKDRKKEEGAKKKGDGIQTAELDRRDQATATKSWPNSPSRKGRRGRFPGSSTYWVKYTHLAPSDNRSTKSADGRVATEAAWLNGNNWEKEEINEAQREKKRKDERKS